MSENALVVGESPEGIAFKLLQTIASNEKKTLVPSPGTGGSATADKKWLLDTYAECLLTVKNPSGRQE